MKEKFLKALAKRRALLTEKNEIVRLVDGAGDVLRGMYLETFADRWLLSTLDAGIPHEAKEFLLESGKTVYHKQLDQHEKKSPAHIVGIAQDDVFTAQENGVHYEISFQSGYSQGIFLDQRDNRKTLLEKNLTGQKILNTFAYTGAFSVCAALAGAETSTLDLSQPYLEWAKRNFSHNQLDPAAHYFCKGDTFHWLNRFHKQGRKFHGIILDPPTFSRDEKGKVFRAEKDYTELAALALSCLEKNAWLLCSTNCRQVTHAQFATQLRAASSRPVSLTENPMPPDFSESRYLKSVWLHT